MKALRYIRPGQDGWSLDFPVDDYATRMHGLEFTASLEKRYSDTVFKDFVFLMVSEFWLSDDLIEYMTSKYTKPNIVYSTFYTRIDLKTEIQVCLIDNFLRRFAKGLSKYSIADSNTITTTKPFNFMANRKRINRHLLCKLVEYFDLIDCAEYTWSGADKNYDLSQILLELDSVAAPWAEQIRPLILSPIQIQKRWVHTDQDVHEPLLNYTTKNTVAWNQGLNLIFDNTAVSLISESIDYQEGAGFTEKSVYPMLGLNLPIWVGGKYQASEFEKFGFDVFDDIIDHSYQYCDTLIERCYRAIADNRDILSDLSKASETRSKMMPRLLQNRQRVLEVSANPDIGLQRTIDSIARLPDTVPQEFKDEITDFNVNVFKLLQI